MAFRCRRVVQNLVKLGSLQTCFTSMRSASFKLSRYPTRSLLPTICNTPLPPQRFYSDDGFTVEERLLKIFRSSEGIVSENLTLNAHVMNNLGLDSLDVVHVVMAIEDEFNIAVPDEDVLPLQTVGHFLNMVKLKLDEWWAFFWCSGDFFCELSSY